MLAFITDMANSYGKDIKAICDKELVTRLIGKIRAYKNKRIESELVQQEEVYLYTKIIIFLLKINFFHLNFTAFENCPWILSSIYWLYLLYMFVLSPLSFHHSDKPLYVNLN
jgi:hypothetical protein